MLGLSGLLNWLPLGVFSFSFVCVDYSLRLRVSDSLSFIRPTEE
jgi:hypothetical protein